MEARELKSELAALDSKGRRQMIAFLLALEDQNNQEYREELARRIDDKDPNHWVSLDEVERRLGLGGHNE